MKSNIHFIFFLLYLVGVSCSDKETNVQTDEDLLTTKNIYLKLCTIQQKPRAEIEPSQSDTMATVYTAILYFLDDADDPLCWKIKTVGTTNADITIEQLNQGAILEGIPVQTTQVYVVGNWNSCDENGNYAAFPRFPGTTLSEIKSTILDINQIAYWQLADGTITGTPPTNPSQEAIVLKVAMMDELAPLRDYESEPEGWTGGNGPVAGDQYAQFTLTPLVARLEFSTVINTLNANVYTFNEIFINNYYQNLPLTLEKDRFPLIHNGDIAAKYRPNDPLFAYTDYRAMYNPFELSVNSTEDIAISAGTDDNTVFGFHVFGGSPAPQLVVRITNLTFRDNTTAAERFATVKFQDQNGSEITSFERNKIYRPYQNIEGWGYYNGFQIRFGDLTETPDPAPGIEILVNVEVIDWINLNVTSVLDN